MKTLQIFEKIAFGIGLLLLLVNTVGLFTNLRNPEIYHESGVSYRDQVILTEAQFYEKLDSLNPQDKAAYAESLNQAVNEGIAHYWRDEGIDQYHLRIPLYENYLLYLASFIEPKYFLKYEFTDYRRAVERGVGLCSQQAVIEAEILGEVGIEARIIELSGHVVLQAKVENNKWVILDPDYGIVIPASIQAVEETPRMIEPYYQNAGYSSSTISRLVRIYGKEGNALMESPGVKGYRSTADLVEKLSYLLIWAIPILLGAPLFIRSAPHKKNQGTPPA